MAQVISSNKILSYHKMYVAPQMVFETPLYIDFKGGLRQCKVKRIETIVEDTTAPYKQLILAEVAGVGVVKFHQLIAFKSIMDYRNDVPCYENYHYTMPNKAHLCGELYSVKDVINQFIIKTPLCSFTDYGQGIGNHLTTYKWNGTKTEYHQFNISNIIIQSENSIRFADVDINKELVDCYYTKEECDQSNTIKVVNFESEQPNKEEMLETLNELLTHCKDARDCIRKLTQIVGINTLNGHITKLDDDVISQELLSEWNVSIHQIEEFVFN